MVNRNAIGPIRSVEDLEKIKERYRPVLAHRLTNETPDKKADENISFPRQILFCRGTSCMTGHSETLQAAFEKEIERRGWSDQVHVGMTGCFGFCDLGPVVIIHPEGILYCRVKPEDLPEICDDHLEQGNLVERLLYRSSSTGQPIKRLDENDFFRGQVRVALRNCGLIDPEDIHEYIAHDGYFALAKALMSMSPQQVVETVEASQIRGRGGAGFPSGKKWSFTAGVKDEKKYIVCNGDEGDPGAFMDRSLMEGDPHGIIEAMVIAGYAVAAHLGYLYVRADYTLAVHRLETAIGQAKAAGLLGKNILGSGFDFDLELRLGAGAFVCGEETALLRSVTGRRGEPRPRPPYPAVSGLWDRPTLLNNVETYANIPQIILRGPEWFATMGTERSKGTKVFSIAGKVNNTGLIEVPMGTTLRRIIYDIGGGIPQGRKFKAVQMGGPTGGILPEAHLDTPIDFDSLHEIGSMMGSGGIIVMDEQDCMVDMARFYLQFSVDESCGKCVPCRIGTKRLLEKVIAITEGRGEMEDLEIIEELSRDIKEGAICGLGQTAPNPVISTLNYFRDEVLAHIQDKRCPAGVCKVMHRPKMARKNKALSRG
ncbi:NADH-quinone oxidoreductase subunit F [Heliobacillus mobilis]|uniref:NADH-quinone oxidoreductase subunit F n=1 Tax=Heliobacterium mobile TaxID=28064 RepID=A0A6I3SIA8_HELMO|nr:NuoF family protein [Heliobacterium mobile]MTV48407.1 NADH-quinone oxidoreductase subunit F [Heliobacterium mobile]